MPYVPNKTSVINNRSVSAIKAALPGFVLKLNPEGHVNLDSILGLSRQADYINKVLSPLERAGEIEFTSTEPLKHAAEQAVASKKKFEDNVDKLLREEQALRAVTPKRTTRRKPVPRRPRPIVEVKLVVEEPIEKTDEGLDDGTAGS